MHPGNTRPLPVFLLKPPVLEEGLRSRLSAIDFAALTDYDLGPESWPMGLEQHLISYHSKAFQIADENDEKVLEELGISLRTMPLSEIEARPQAELAAYFIWQFIEASSIDISTIVRANSLLGGSGQLRLGRMGTRTTISGHRIVFDCRQPADKALRLWLNDFHKPVARKQVIERNIWLYMNFLIAHPFTDGNGRTARLLFQAYLYIHGFLKGPIIPITPFILCNQKAVISKSLDWELNDNAENFYEFFLRGVSKTEDVIRAIQN